MTGLSVRAQWHHALLVCRKCSKRAGKVYGADRDESLPRALRGLPGHGKGRKARVGMVEVACLKLCPKRGAVVVDTRDPERWRVVRPGDAVDDLRD